MDQQRNHIHVDTRLPLQMDGPILTSFPPLLRLARRLPRVLAQPQVLGTPPADGLELRLGNVRATVNEAMAE